MKKFVVSILAIAYLLVSSGLAVNAHYCMGKLASVDIYGHGSEKCGTCGMKNSSSNGCCKDEFHIVKLQDSHKLTELTYKFDYTFSTAIVALNQFLSSPLKSCDHTQKNIYPPPDISTPSLTVLHCIFRC